MIVILYLQVPQFGEGVYDDTEYDVEADGSDEDEERHMVKHEWPE